jgi:cytoskeletal protein RodZ
MAYVVLRPDHKGTWKGKDFAAELKQFSRSRLPGFARPGECDFFSSYLFPLLLVVFFLIRGNVVEWVEVIDELPKNSTGKVRENTERGTLYSSNDDDREIGSEDRAEEATLKQRKISWSWDSPVPSLQHSEEMQMKSRLWRG